MAEIVLVWNVHVNESPATLPFARKLRTDLEKRGHTVRIIKVPFKKSEHGISWLAFDYFEAKKRGKSAQNDIRQEIWQNTKDRKLPFIVWMHSTPIERIFARWHRISPTKKTGKWIADVTAKQLFFSIVAEIQLSKDKKRREYCLEIPAAYSTANPNLEKFGERYPIIDRRYAFHIADLKKTRAANVFSDTVVRKAGHLIDTEVNTVLKKYRISRSLPHKRRFTLKERKHQRQHNRRRI